MFNTQLTNTTTMRTQLISACERLLIINDKNLHNQQQNDIIQQKNKVGILLSGGVDTGCIMGALKDMNQQISAAITVVIQQQQQQQQTTAIPPPPPDLNFSIAIAKQFNIDHHHIEIIQPRDLLADEILDLVVSSCMSFDPMQIRNALVIAYALNRAKTLEPQITTWITGDGADELLGGYSFMWKELDPIKWKLARDQMVLNAYYAGDSIARTLNLSVKSPFRDDQFIAWAFQHVNRNECVGERKVFTRLDEYNETKLVITGKVLLRDSFPEVISSLRRKDPIEVGSGSHLLTVVIKDQLQQQQQQQQQQQNDNDTYFLQEQQRVLTKYGIRLRQHDYEQVLYFQHFEKCILLNGNHERNNNQSGDTVCKACHFNNISDNFCRTCGEWPCI
jgi:asparagine synthase (glutamine-hydrolysing)